MPDRTGENPILRLTKLFEKAADLVRQSETLMEKSRALREKCFQVLTPRTPLYTNRRYDSSNAKAAGWSELI
jgi:hypothetical protein